MEELPPNLKEIDPLHIDLLRSAQPPNENDGNQARKLLDLGCWDEYTSYLPQYDITAPQIEQLLGNQFDIGSTLIAMQGKQAKVLEITDYTKKASGTPLLMGSDTHELDKSQVLPGVSVWFDEDSHSFQVAELELDKLSNRNRLISPTGRWSESTTSPTGNIVNLGDTFTYVDQPRTAPFIKIHDFEIADDRPNETVTRLLYLDPVFARWHEGLFNAYGSYVNGISTLAEASGVKELIKPVHAYREAGNMSQRADDVAAINAGLAQFTQTDPDVCQKILAEIGEANAEINCLVAPQSGLDKRNGRFRDWTGTLVSGQYALGMTKQYLGSLRNYQPPTQ
jgi:hypothetical protein